jgi:hypothetical protein
MYSSEYPLFDLRKNQAVDDLVSLYICVQKRVLPQQDEIGIQ